ncbi:MAG TPA: biotin--[acetyl-CoA-carboxylase] ligase [Gammaproteobacteria bacterium]|nr:biotin--[acetyl-CoA-carboxylase] ligase [Gammaproteobacteria bacterium]
MNDQPEKLGLKLITSGLSPENQVYLSNVEILESTDSTNSFLLTHLKAHPLSGQVCFAEEQTQGRGRQGKIWYSPAYTNIYCSLSWCFPTSFQNLSALSIVCGAVIILALKKLGVQQLGLKWPNDVLYSGRKLAGILIETIISPHGNLAVIGIGLNLNLPAEKRSLWASLDEALNIPISRNHVAGILLNELLTQIPVFQTQGLKPFLALCNEHDILRGKEINAKEISGTVQGISERGELIILDKNNQQHFLTSSELSLGSDNRWE